MSLPTMTGVGRLTGDVEVRFSQSGTAVGTVPLAFNARRRNKQTNEWEDGDVFFVRGTVFGDTAEYVQESLSRGMEVVVTGRLKTDQWEDKESGQKRSATSLLIDSIGPSLRFATAAVRKVERGAGQSAPAGDSWGSAPPNNNFSDEPPF
ncbi:single-stranded DNA-binding protein [Saccharopolyspora sp. 6T]|uniref:single-stranded DNA-binding protein n=1 Tax=Saccharopolyspora sp. 6T TaxID=2877238 RepID=UPI001CD1D1FA|nr:single-stranded DNA-binding protein [Saccharopolyspora sp. 6T]MCA1185770.1 single-stranded DNA-binding protein [Saccharopolyspora sp. 6T]